jgi:hypothetical protein
MLRRYFSAALRFGPLLMLNLACADRALSPSACSDVTVRVSAGLQPAFSWNPACRIEGLAVHLPGPGPIVWSTMSSRLSNTIATPVRYGVFPDGAAQTANILLPLVAGTRYQVTLFRGDDSPGGSLRSVGVTTFVP